MTAGRSRRETREALERFASGTDPLEVAKEVPVRKDVAEVCVKAQAAGAAGLRLGVQQLNLRKEEGEEDEEDEEDEDEEAGPLSEEASLPCADDLLSLVVLLLTRAGVQSLCAHTVYIDNFLSLQTPFQHKGELG